MRSVWNRNPPCKIWFQSDKGSLFSQVADSLHLPLQRKSEFITMFHCRECCDIVDGLSSPNCYMCIVILFCSTDSPVANNTSSSNNVTDVNDDQERRTLMSGANRRLYCDDRQTNTVSASI